MNIINMLNLSSADRLFIIPPFFALGLILSLLTSSWITISILTIAIAYFLIHYKKYYKSIFILWTLVGLAAGSILGWGYTSLYLTDLPLKHKINNIMVSGKIIDIQDNARKARIILKTEQDNLPQYIRLNISTSDYAYLSPNDYIEAKAFLAPPSDALFEGAYNFAFYAKMNRFGATGRINKIMKHTPSEWNLNKHIHNIRINIAQKIQAILTPSQSAPIIAMVTGSRFNIPNNIQEAWKQSGIYHLLSISGLHMTIIAGMFFLVIRYLLLLIPKLAHGGKVKKIAAFCVIPMAYGYVLLSGGAVPVMRAYIMVCVGLIAILCDQRVITLRSACIAFCCVLIINPVDIFNIGFALSFAAVFGIIIAVNLLQHLKQKLKTYKVVDFLCINFFAGYSGMPLAIYTFGSNALYGLIANSFAVPFASLALMPLITFSILLMIFDVHHYPLLAVGYCIELLNEFAFFISNLPNSVLYQQPPLLVWVILFYIGLYIFALNNKKSLMIGTGFFLAAIMGHSLTSKHELLKIPSEDIIFYIDQHNNLIKLVKYEKPYLNPFVKEQVFTYFGHNPNNVYYYEICNKNKKYTTYSGKEFHCIYKK